MNTAQLHELIDELKTANTIMKLHQLEKVGLNQIASAYKAKEINWLQELWFRFQFNDAVYRRSAEIRPHVYS